MKAALGTGEHGTRETVVLDAKAALRQTLSVLNTRHEKRYLFAGDATSTKPFGDIETFLSDVRSIAAGRHGCRRFRSSIGRLFQHTGLWLAG
jgi:hypothetical protein